MRPFSERNPFIIGAVGISATVGLLLLSLNYQHLPFVSRGKDYSAYFAEAGGLKSGAIVQVSGADVGKVSSIGVACGVPYTAAVEEKTRCLTPAAIIAEHNESEPPRLFVKYFAGSRMDSPTAMNAAKWITASQRFSRSSPASRPVSAMSMTCSRPSGTLCR